MNDVTIVQLEWADDPIGSIDFPSKRLTLRHGIGSGLCVDPRDHSTVWAIADRGPNLELHTAVDDYGWSAPAAAGGNKDAKLMPRLDIGPYLARLRIDGSAVHFDATLPIRTPSGERVPGLPLPGGGHSECEPAFDMDGAHLQPHPAGMDTEGVACLADGSFWLGDEYGPSLLKVGPDGKAIRRLLPQGAPTEESPFPVDASLPALAERRHLNRGFEAVTATPSQDRLYLAFQSPLAHPDRATFEKARHLRIWELDCDGVVQHQYLYPFDPPDSFRRDREERELGWKDLKVCELAAAGESTLLVLERSMQTSKIYRVEVDEALRTPPEHLDIATRPSIEELSGADDDFPLPVLSKTLLFSSDNHPEVGPDMEGMTALTDRSLLLVSDNDFGVQDKKTQFYRLDFAEPFAA